MSFVEITLLHLLATIQITTYCIRCFQVPFGVYLRIRDSRRIVLKHFDALTIFPDNYCDFFLWQLKIRKF
jgi:hypothetical protein